MSAAREAGDCRRFERWLTAYVDDELDAIHSLEVEEHLASCEECSEYVAGMEATRVSLQRVCKMRAPAQLCERISLSLGRHDEGDRASSPESAPGDSLDAAAVDPRALARRAPDALDRASVPPHEDSAQKKLRYLVPLAAAATFALVIGAIQLRQEQAPSAVSVADSSESVAKAATFDNLIEDLVVQHADPPPMETTDPEGLRRFDPFIGVHVRQPRFDQVDARYVGARMANRQAAMLQYVLRDRHRVTMYVFDPRKVSPRSSHRLQPREVNARKMYVGMVRGYAVAASERDGIGYALASDLSDEESAELLAMAAR